LLESGFGGGHCLPNAASEERRAKHTSGSMRAVLRGKFLLLALGLATPAVALAQAVPDTTTNAPAPAPGTTIGPRDLQNFSLPGTPAKPADQPPATPPAARQPAPTTAAPVQTAPPAAEPARRAVAERQPTTKPVAPVAQATAAPPPAQAPALLPPSPAVAPTFQAPAPAPTSALPAAPATDSLAPAHRPPFLPWLLAALALAAGAAFILWRRRSPREAYAGVPELDVFTPEPEAETRVTWQPAPTAEPAPPAAAPRNVVSTAFKAPPAAPAPVGVVSSRLRPSLEIGVKPLRCVVDDQEITIEFELELFNAGTAPARAIHAEASIINASATQDQDLAAFFANASPTPDRLDVIAPMKRIALTSRVVAPRSAIQEYELAGRKSFVPLIAFNAVYQWSGGGTAQTSAAYLVGRETSSDKLGPLRLDLGPRDFRSLAAHVLPAAVRT
jgi:hypothetical protein